MNTTIGLTQAIGKQGHLSIEKLSVMVHIMDTKVSYGTVRYLITPVSGSGQTWVNADRVQIEKEEVQS